MRKKAFQYTFFRQRKPLRQCSTHGYVLALAIVSLFTLSSIGITLASVATAKYSKTKRDIYLTAANYTAEAGISDTISKLNDNSEFAGFYPDSTTETKEFYNSTDNGRAVYNTKVTAHASNGSKTIVSTGKIYIPNTSTTPINTKTIKATVTLNTEPSSYPVVAGPGGLELGAGSSLLASKVYSAGKVQLASGSGSIGSTTSPTQVSVANAACTDSGGYFPSLCPTSSPPITIGAGSGGVNGTVCASNQPLIDGITTAQLQSSCAPARNVINTSNRPALHSIFSTSTGATSCTTSSSGTIPANLRFTGNVVISGGCNITLSGSIYVEGDITVSGATTRITPALTIGDDPIVVMATGTIRINGATINSNANGAVIRMISFKSNSPTCSSSSTCTDVTKVSGGSLQTSMNMDAVICENGCKASKSDLIAYFGRVVLHGSTVNPSIIRSAAGQSVTVRPSSGAITVTNSDDILPDIAIARWAIVDYKQVYN